jgi:hypothetical protein
MSVDFQSVSDSFGIGTRSKILQWRIFLSANRNPLRRNMRYPERFWRTSFPIARNSPPAAERACASMAR